MTFEVALCTYVSDLGYATTRPDVDLQDLVNTHGAVIRLRRAGGTQQRWQTIARIAVEVYANTYDGAWSVAESLTGMGGRLLASPYRTEPGPTGWRVDRARSESANTEQPHPNLRVVASVIRLTTRSS